MEENVHTITPDPDVISWYKEFLPPLKEAKKRMEFICKKQEGINCHSCPLQIEHSSDVGTFKICMYYGLIDGMRSFKKEIKWAERNVGK